MKKRNEKSVGLTNSNGYEKVGGGLCPFCFAFGLKEITEDFIVQRHHMEPSYLSASWPTHQLPMIPLLLLVIIISYSLLFIISSETHSLCLILMYLYFHSLVARNPVWSLCNQIFLYIWRPVFVGAYIYWNLVFLFTIAVKNSTLMAPFGIFMLFPKKKGRRRR